MVLKELSEGDTLNDKTQDPEEVSYASLRAEACLHYELRKECFTKAKEAYSRGLLAAASYYAQQVSDVF